MVISLSFCEYNVMVTKFNTANDFGEKFDELTEEARNLSENLGLLPSVTDKKLAFQRVFYLYKE